MYLIVGLGNPGEKYQKTRHNLGFMVIEELAKRLNTTLGFNRVCKSLESAGQISETKVWLAMPQTFMNNSGEAVFELLRWHKIHPSHLIVIHDDVDFEVGEIKIRFANSAAGHHGIESIISHLGTNEFIRIRIGIGRESLEADVTDYVLSEIPPAQKPQLEPAIVEAAEAVCEIVQKGLESAMNRFNH